MFYVPIVMGMVKVEEEVHSGNRETESLESIRKKHGNLNVIT